MLSFFSNNSTAGLASIATVAAIAAGIAIGSYLGSLFWPHSTGVFTTAPRIVKLDDREDGELPDEDWDLSSVASAASAYSE